MELLIAFFQMLFGGDISPLTNFVSSVQSAWSALFAALFGG